MQTRPHGTPPTRSRMRAATRPVKTITSRTPTTGKVIISACSRSALTWPLIAALTARLPPTLTWSVGDAISGSSRL